MSAPAFHLAAGETELRRWTVSRRSFLLRCVAQFAVTLTVMLPIWWQYDVVVYVLAAVMLAPGLMWTFGDFSIWRDTRHTQWLLSDQALHSLGPDSGEDVDLRLALQEIRNISTLLPWSLVLRLRDGTAITLPLAPKPATLRRDILHARDAALNRVGSQ